MSPKPEPSGTSLIPSTRSTTTVVVIPQVDVSPIPTGPGGVFRGSSITISGIASATRETFDNSPPLPGEGPPDSIFEDATDDITAIAVRLGAGGTFTPATPTGTGTTPWASWATTRQITGVVSDHLQITARVTVGNVTATDTVTVTVDRTPPTLSLSTPTEMTTTVPQGSGATFRLAGTVTDQLSNVTSVQCVRGSQVVTATLSGPSGPGAVRNWQADVAVPLGTHQVLVRARDQEGNESPAKLVTLNALVTFQPADPDDLFGQAAYLDDLANFFVPNRLVTGAAPSAPAVTAALLAQTFHQRFAELTDPGKREIALQPVHQTRVAVEILRRFLVSENRPVPASVQTGYQDRAYDSLLRHLGTSFDELRRTRGDKAARAALAARLQVDQPDRLDSLLLLPDQRTEAALERLFGLVDTGRDVLGAAGLPPEPALRTWRLARLRGHWKAADDAARVFGDVPRPVIDPDLLVPADFRTPQRTDPAFELFTDRADEVARDLATIRGLRRGRAPLEGFDAMVDAVVPPVAELRKLLEEHTEGIDVTARLAAERLTLPAFLRLMDCRQLAVDRMILEADWADVEAILTQVRKVGRYPAWRAQEQEPGRNVVLGPDHFTAPATAPPPDLPPWRATVRDRRAWLETLRARSSEDAAAIQAIQDVADAAETETLPGLRDMLAAQADQTGQPAGSLLTDLEAAPSQRTTRVGQALETLHQVVFAVRLRSFPDGHPAASWRLKPGYDEEEFDADWEWFGSHDTWRAAMQVFIYPESSLLPTTRPAGEQTTAFRELAATLRQATRLTPAEARAAAADYLAEVPNQSLGLPSGAGLVLTEQLTDAQLIARRQLSETILETALGSSANPHQAPSVIKEVFYFVPLLIAQQLQRAGEFLAATDWIQTVYAYHLSAGTRKVYHGLVMEETIGTSFQRDVDWPRVKLSPHDVAADRAHALTRYAVLTLARCLVEFGDDEFTRETTESIPRARSLYSTVLEVLDREFPPPPAGASPTAQDPGRNPAVEALRLHADASLRKLRAGLNIAGLERRADPGDPSAVAPRQPTPYRYAALVTRAKELAQTAGQMEAALLAALEKRDAEAYNLLRARHDLELAQEGVRLQDLRVEEALSGVTLAELQQDRAEIQVEHFEDLLDQGQTLEYVSMFAGLAGATFAALTQSGLKQAGSFLSGLGTAFGQFASIQQRQRDWEFQKALAQQDVLIAAQQEQRAQVHLGVVSQEHRIAQAQAFHAQATADFLARKETGVELYEFMSTVLAGVYRFFLRHATALARLAEQQLAFERQEQPRSVIVGDYWEPDSAAGVPDRNGTTGSARLLADVTKLDQHAFLTDRRKLQLTHTISLSRLDPIEFERFRRSGVMVFATPEELFDRAFPGHYLRLVKQVRVTLVALVPPTDGIRATLSTPGLSRTVISTGGGFRATPVRRDPETVALSTPRDATGLFDLVPDARPDLLLPFEGSGVDTVWRLELPKAANQIDYTTIADALITLEYEALHSGDYRRQVVQRLDPRASADRPFSLRHQFPDQWFDLHNPDQTSTPMAVRLSTGRADFPPNLQDLRVQHVALFLARKDGTSFEVTDVELRFTPSGAQQAVGGPADTVDGLISTRRGNGQAWLPMIDTTPVGTWELTLPDTDELRNHLAKEEMEDILLSVTYSGETPEWPL